MRSIADRTVDLLVIGGGIIGAGIARDAALRGLSVALVEQADFASGTTSRPTRLIHGGLRYLELFDFGLVRSDMREREILLRIAPHLVFPLPFLLPLYRPSLVYQFKLRLGMQLYDWLSLDKTLPKRKYLDRAATLAAEPNLKPDGLTGAWRFYDAQVPLVERLVVENVVDAAAHGALVLNHARATGYTRDGDRVTGATIRDAVAGSDVTIRARYTVNATGPWLDGTISLLHPGTKPLLRLTKGIHLVTPRATEQAHVLFSESDGRLFFVVGLREDGEPLLSLVDLTVRRNAYGRQVDSFEADVDVDGVGEVRGVFIRAPWVDEVGDGVRVLAEHDGRPVILEQGNLVVCAFHPELARDARLHAYLLEKVGS